MPLLTRRRFLGLIASGCGLPFAPSCQPASAPPTLGIIPGRFLNPNPIRGHLLRSRTKTANLPAVPEARFDAVVVGGGISGLCAARRLVGAGVGNLLLLELESRLGGTSMADNTPGSECPWGAHYIHVPPPEADCVHELLGEIGVIEGYDARGWPLIPDEYLLRWPHERLYSEGTWGRDLSPLDELSEGDREQFLRFKDDMLRWALYRGRDGRKAFAMPLRYSTSDAAVRELDHISMREYISRRGWSAEWVSWLTDYACRDDYGGTASQVSAWAGVHYFACRNYDYRIEADYPTDVLTWPTGNGFLAERLSGTLEPHQRQVNAAVTHIAENGEGLDVGFVDLESGEMRLIHGKTVVYAGKLYTAPHVVRGLPAQQRSAMSQPIYCPWLVAAVRTIRPLAGFGEHWENILYDSPSVGYVNPDHQRSLDKQNNQLIYYLPLCDDPQKSRRDLQHRDHQYWASAIVADLLPAHPDLLDLIEGVDIYRWGHGMVRPSPGLLWGASSRWRRQPLGGIFFATCDATGLPLFEEAVFNGYRAAEEALARLGVGFETSLKGLTDG